MKEEADAGDLDGKAVSWGAGGGLWRSGRGGGFSGEGLGGRGWGFVIYWLAVELRVGKSELYMKNLRRRETHGEIWWRCFGVETCFRNEDSRRCEHAGHCWKHDGSLC